MTRELSISLLAAWLASWAAEERALDAAARAHELPGDVVGSHRARIRREREQLGPLLACF